LLPPAASNFGLIAKERKLAIEKFVNQMPEIVVIDGAIVRFKLGAAFEAPKAAAVLAETPADQRPSIVEDLLECGATVVATAKTSAHVVMMESKVQELLARVGDHLKDADRRTVKSVEKVLNEFQKDLVKFLSAREAVIQKSVLRGARFEDILSARLPLLARGIGRVEHCAGSAGDNARNAGDYVVTVESAVGGAEVKIVIEAKARKIRFSNPRIREELRAARLNRDAQAAVLVAETTDSLPDGIGFGQVTERDFFVVFSPETGDETLLSCALVMAKAAALATVKGSSCDGIDLAAVSTEVNSIRKLVEQFSKIEVSHSKIDKEVTNARNAAADLKADILAAVRRLEGHLN
jgi:hypothetical protein